AVFAAIVTCSRPAPPGTTATLTFGRGLHGPAAGVGEGPGVGVPGVGVGGFDAAPVTGIVPSMKGCRAQKYGKRLGELNVNPNDWPGFRKPESQTPALLVLVWVVMPLLVQVTRVPTETVSVLGWKSKSTMATALPWA